MYDKFFENAITYSGSDITHFCLSSLKYVRANRPIIGSLSQEMFDISNILKPEKLITYYKDFTEYKIIVQKDILELAKVFGIPFENFSSISLQKTETKIAEYKGRILALIIAINMFLTNRLDFISCNKIDEILPSFLKNEADNIIEIFSFIKETFPEINYDVNDYHLVNGKLIFTKRPVKVHTFYNYQELRKVLKELSLSENEYYDYHYKKDEILKLIVFHKNEYKNTGDKRILSKIKDCEDILSQINETIDRINEHPSYNRELLCMLSMILEQLIEQEKAIEDFIDKILHNKLQITEVCTFESFRKSLEQEVREEMIKNRIMKDKVNQHKKHQVLGEFDDYEYFTNNSHIFDKNIKINNKKEGDF